MGIRRMWMGGIGEKLGSWVVLPNFCGFSFTPWTSSIHLPYSYSQTVEFTWDLILSPHLRHRRLQWPLDHRTPLLETVQQEIRTDGVENTLMEMLYYFELNPNVVEKTTYCGKEKNRKPTSWGWFIATYGDFGGCFTGFTTLVWYHLWSLINLKSWVFNWRFNHSVCHLHCWRLPTQSAIKRW